MKEISYKLEIAKILDQQGHNVYLYHKGRVALFAALRAMGISEGDEVILPAYTCVVVPNAIKYVGAKPIYVDVQPDTYSVRYEDVLKYISTKTKAVIVQNTYGLYWDLEKYRSLKEKGIFIIEDCTHGFSGFYNDIPNGKFGDVAFFSTQWNKPFSSVIGGFLSLNNTSLKPVLEEYNKNLEQPSLFDGLQISVQYYIHKYLLNDATYWPLIRLYRLLSKHNIIRGSSQGAEIESPIMPLGFFKYMSKSQISVGLKNIQKLSGVNLLRKKNASLYTLFLKQHGKNHIPETYFKNHLFLKYPLLVKDRALFMNLAEKFNIKLGDWFTSPIHPVSKGYEIWDLDIENYPNAKKLSAHVVNLPTDIDNTDKVIKFLGIHLHLIE